MESPPVKKGLTAGHGFAAVTMVAVLAGGYVALDATVLPTDPASATNPVVTVVANCNTATGLYDFATTVHGDTGHPNETATIVSQSRATTPTLVGQSVKGAGTVTSNELGVAITTKTVITQTVSVQWTNHSKGDLVSASGKITVAGDCKKVPGPPTQTVNCQVIEGNYNAPLENGKHINTTIVTTVNGKDVELGQVNMFVDGNIKASDYVKPEDLPQYAGNGNLGLRWKILDVEQTPIPLTVEQINSGIISFAYGAPLKAALAKLGYYSWKVTFVQTNETDKWDVYVCDDTKEDASASVSITTLATCTSPGIPTAITENAKQVRGDVVRDDIVLDKTVGTHSATFQANGGSWFPGKKAQLTVTYPVPPADLSLCNKDAKASFEIVSVASCTSAKVVKETLVNATADTPLPTAPGVYDRAYSSIAGSVFADGTQHAILELTIEGKKSDKDPSCISGGIQTDALLVSEEGQPTVWAYVILALLATIAALIVIWLVRRSQKA